jgi:hypothetical protein
MWEYLAGVITEPVRSLREVAAKKLWKEGLLLLVVIALLDGTVGIATYRSGLLQKSALLSLPGMTPSLLATLFSPGIFLPYMLIDILLLWFIGGALFYGFSKLFQGRGTLPGMLASLAFAETPFLLCIPLSALALLLGNVTGPLLGSTARMVSALWVLVLDVLAIRESQQIGALQSIGVILLTVAAYIVFAVLLGIVIGVIALIVGLAGK